MSRAPRGTDPALGSRLLGDHNDSPRRRRRRLVVMLAVFLAGANVVGTVVALISIVWVIPGPDVLDLSRYGAVKFIVVPAFMAVGTAIGGTISGWRTARSLEWALQGRTPSPSERAATLAIPWRLTALQMGLWGTGLVVVSVFYGLTDPHAVPKVALGIAVGGALVSAFGYLLTEFSMRPIASHALGDDHVSRRFISGVLGRSVLSWILGTGVPMVALMLIAVIGMLGDRPTVVELEIAILAFCGFGILFGFSLLILGGTASMAPINAVRTAMAAVAAGDTDIRLRVYDGTELGQLQSGFNAMAEGLQERERIRDLFGRHVGVDVAAAALASQPELGGEERDVTILFVDLVGSTTLAATRPPAEVVELLNRFFDVVVDVVDRDGGFVNKFEGDAALAVFGAPTALDNHRGHGLDAAIAMRDRLRSEVSECTAAISVASGRAVAGNIGAKARFEYTVIGDPVNEAARLSELAKTVAGGVVASGYTVAHADAESQKRWSSGNSVTLRGRLAETVIAVPKD